MAQPLATPKESARALDGRVRGLDGKEDQMIFVYSSRCMGGQLMMLLKPVKVVTEAGSFDLPQDVSEGITEGVMAKLCPDRVCWFSPKWSAGVPR